MLLLSPPQLAGRVLSFLDHTCPHISALLAAPLPRLRASHCFRRLTTRRSPTPRRLRLAVLPPGASFDLMRPPLVWPDSSSRWLMGFCISLSAFAKSASCLLLESPSARVRCPHHRFARQIALDAAAAVIPLLPHLGAGNAHTSGPGAIVDTASLCSRLEPPGLTGYLTARLILATSCRATSMS